MTSEMRRLMNIVENKTTKASPYNVCHYDGPANVSSTVLNRTTIYANNRSDLNTKVKAWMESIGLDPDDEDDMSTITIG